MPPTRPNVARRRIPVADPSVVQLVLGLPTDEPLRRMEREAPEPTPLAPVVALRVRRAAA